MRVLSVTHLCDDRIGHAVDAELGQLSIGFVRTEHATDPRTSNEAPIPIRTSVQSRVFRMVAAVASQGVMSVRGDDSVVEVEGFGGDAERGVGDVVGQGGG